MGGGKEVYYIGPQKVSKKLYDDFAVCEEYEALRKSGIETEEIAAIGEKCAQVAARLQAVVDRENSEKVKEKSGAVVKAKASGPRKYSKSSKMPSLKTGINSRGVRYYKIDGKFASKDAYCAAGGRAKACKEDGKKAMPEKKEKKEKKAKSGYYSKKGKDGVVRYFKDGRFVSKVEYDSHKKK